MLSVPASYTLRKSFDDYLPLRGLGRNLYGLSGAPTEAGANPGNGDMRFQNVSFAVVSPQGPLAEVAGHGANTTDLNANFADMFPDVVAKGRKASGSITGIGGTQTFESIELAELRILLGGKPVIARPAGVTMQRMLLEAVPAASATSDMTC